MTDKKDEDPIGKALGITPFKTFDAVNDLMVSAHDDSAKADFEMARANISSLIEKGKDTIEELTLLAVTSQDPKAYDSLTRLLGTLVSANKEMLELQVKIREIESADVPSNENAKTINNNLFVGSTSELQKMIESMKNDRSSTD